MSLYLTDQPYHDDDTAFIIYIVLNGIRINLFIEHITEASIKALAVKK